MLLKDKIYWPIVCDDRRKMTFQEFCEHERALAYQGYLENHGMLAHAEFTSEPRDWDETTH